MNPVKSAFRGVARVADTTTAAAGAVGGAAINGVVGGIQGAANGARSGLSSGRHSSAAAAVTLGAIGAVGLVEWPLLVAVGGTALVLHQINQRSSGADAARPATAPRKSTPQKSTPRKSSPRKSTARKSAARSASAK
ncbi:hypothetical protein FIV07_26690 [Mycobacterium sp. THAF192]|nr:hypothetical protein FIV07_26690 [Mycobacterium sp. THAF192]